MSFGLKDKSGEVTVSVCNSLVRLGIRRISTLGVRLHSLLLLEFEITCVKSFTFPFQCLDWMAKLT